MEKNINTSEDPHLVLSAMIAQDGQIRKLNLDLSKEVFPREFDRIQAGIRARIHELSMAIRQKKNP